MSDDKIFVTKPFLPPLSDFLPHFEEIWASKVLSNGGPKHKALEHALQTHLGVDQLALFNNATVALCTALQALDLSGEVITTPFSFVATANAIKWNGLKPVFVDIRSSDFNIDPNSIQKAITPKTSAILAVHCYGNPCQVEQIDEIAQKNNLKVVYDAAHAFDVKINGTSILKYGDLSVVSMHATKVFQTFEGGAIICSDLKQKKNIEYLRNFGFKSETELVGAGINGKMNELSAVAGLVQLNYIENIIGKRKNIDTVYRKELSEIAGIRIIEIGENIKSNYSYFPILVENNYRLSRDGLKKLLEKENIFARRYFYPIITEFEPYDIPNYRDKYMLKNAKDAASKILCLPIYPDLSISKVKKIASIIREHQLKNG